MKFNSWFSYRNARETLSIHWHRRKPASPTLLTKSQMYLPPPLTVVRTRTVPALSAFPFTPVVSPQDLPPVSPRRPILLLPPTLTLPAPQTDVASRTSHWIRFSFSAPSPQRLPRRPSPLVPICILAPHSLRPLLAPALCLTLPIRRVKSPKSTKRRIKRRRKGNRGITLAKVLSSKQNRLKKDPGTKRANVQIERAEVLPGKRNRRRRLDK